MAGGGFASYSPLAIAQFAKPFILVRIYAGVGPLFKLRLRDQAVNSRIACCFRTKKAA
jgi:hypothetical protein